MQAEKARILDGSQVKIDKIEAQLSELTKMKVQCHAIDFIKKLKLNNEINEYVKQKNGVMKR